MKLRTDDGQVFDAWVNLPENERNVPKWLGQIGAVSETRTEIVAPDGSQLSIGPGDLVVNEHGRLRAIGVRTAQRLFSIEEGEEELSAARGIVHPSQPENMGRARQGMVTSDRGRLQSDDPIAGKLSDAGAVDPAGAAGNRGSAAAEQDGQRAGESAGDPSPTETTATGGPGGVPEDDPAFGAVGGGGENGSAESDESDNGGEAATEDQGGDATTDTGTEDEAVTPSPRRRGRK